MCIHGGKVNLKAKNAKKIQSNNIPIMLNNEIQGASISGCLNPPILGGPCSKVALVFPYTFTQHQVNNKRAVLQMGLIGVSDKAYPILVIPKKSTIKFSPAKLKANPLSKIEYERIQWERIKKEEESKKDINKVERSKSVSSVVNQEQELPPNVIRIETLDESEEFIEIILPPTFHIDDKPLIDVSDIFIPPALKGVGSTIKGIKGAGNLGKSLTRYATKQEVLNVLKDKYKLETSVQLNKKGLKKDNGKKYDDNANVYMAKDNKQIKEIWKDITEGAEVLDDKGPDSYGDMIKRRKLSDNTILQLRKKSSSKGSAIEINKKDEKPIKIHNKAGENGDW